jgi:hypothetical protein
MKKLTALVCLAVFAAPDRMAIATIERNLDRRIETLFDEPYLLLGGSRGLYLEGTGAVFTAEMALVLSPAGPFAPKLTREEAERIRRKRLDRLPLLRTAIEDFMVRSAAALPSLPPGERLIVGITLFKKTAEDNTGIPSQLVFEGRKGELIEKKSQGVQVREY